MQATTTKTNLTELTKGQEKFIRDNVGVIDVTTMARDMYMPQSTVARFMVREKLSFNVKQKTKTGGHRKPFTNIIFRGGE